MAEPRWASTSWVAHGDDHAVRDGEGFGLGSGHVHGEDRAAGDEEVGARVGRGLRRVIRVRLVGASAGRVALAGAR